MGYEVYFIQNISFKYEAKWVLQEVSFSVQPGAFLGLIGPNGSGKTTLLKVLAGLLVPQKGSVQFRGQDLGAWGHRERARWIGMVPQEALFIYPYTVLEVVLMGRAPYTSLFGFDRSEDVEIARGALKQVGLLHLAHRTIQTLSGGERQMAVIARALAQQPEVLLLDEPTAFLDLSHQLGIYNTLRQLNQTERLTIVTVSHDLNLAAQYCKHLILLSEAKIAAEGPPSAILTQEIIEQVYGCRTLVDPHPLTGRPRVTLIPEGRYDDSET